jgi:hypothetical protein
MAGLLDEIQVHLVPVLLGDDVRLFDHLGTHTVDSRTPVHQPARPAGALSDDAVAQVRNAGRVDDSNGLQLKQTRSRDRPDQAGRRLESGARLEGSFYRYRGKGSKECVKPKGWSMARK